MCFLGKRLFRIWLCMPLRNVEDINARLDVVESVMQHDELQDAFTELAKKLPDMERLVSRVHAGTCKVSDFTKLLEVL
jgi:DNA mismatch repair protein MSH6